MQQITVYLVIDSVRAKVANQHAQSAPAPVLSRGIKTQLHFLLMDQNAKPLQIDNYPVWKVVFDDDFAHDTPPKLASSDVQLVKDDTKTELICTLDTNTEELAAVIDSKASVRLGLEINAFSTGDTQPSFRAQSDGWIVTNSRSIEGAGDPTPLPDQYYTAAQIDALLAAGFVIRYSEAGGDDPGHDVPTDADYYYRFRAATAPDSAPWTAWLKFRGVDGVDGNTFEVVESAEPPTVTTEGAFVLWHKTEA